MAKPTGFLEYTRKKAPYRSPFGRMDNYEEFYQSLPPEERNRQAARCMDCGVPFCQSSYGCPLFNLIPEWNDLIYKGRMREAYFRLRETNNFPEFTARVCPAPCETACVLGINDPPVTIKDNERAIIDAAYEKGWLRAQPPNRRNGRRVAVIGSGPAGLAAADQLNHAGYSVSVYEKSDKPGGLIMYGIPNMKLDKDILSRRLRIMEDEGVKFFPNHDIGNTIDPVEIQASHDALLIAIGAGKARDLRIPGRELKGIHFAMDYLSEATNALVSGLRPQKLLDARDKRVIVIGGGDTGNDCIGTAIRQGAKSVINLELLPIPPAERPPESPWPFFPRILKTDYGHEEAIARFGLDPRQFSILSKAFLPASPGKLGAVKSIRVNWKMNGMGRSEIHERPGSEEEWEADMVLLALGFLGPEMSLIEKLGLKQDQRPRIQVADGSYATSIPGVFIAGDARRGQSLVVWAIHEGREAAREIHDHLS